LRGRLRDVAAENGVMHRGAAGEETPAVATPAAPVEAAAVPDLAAQPPAPVPTAPVEPVEPIAAQDTAPQPEHAPAPPAAPKLLRNPSPAQPSVERRLRDWLEPGALDRRVRYRTASGTALLLD